MMTDSTTSRPPETGALPIPSPLQVAALRVRCGLSLDQWATALGLSPRTVRWWESGRYGMSPESAERVRGLVADHDALIADLRAGADLPDGPMPRHWYLSAYGQTLA